MGVIGFLLSPHAVKTLLLFSSPSHRIGKIVLDVRDRRFHIFCVYAPTAVDNHKAECRTFYDELSSIVIDIPLRDHFLVNWSYIALPSIRTDLVTSTRQFQEKGFHFVTALSSVAQISLPKSIAPTCVRSWNNNNFISKLGVRFRERIIDLANTVHNIQKS